MRRLLSIAFITLALITLLTSCSNSKPENIQPILSFKGDIISTSISTKQKLLATLTVNPSGTIEIEPTTTKGLKFIYQNSQYLVSYNDLTYQADSPFLPDQSFALAIIQVINKISQDTEVEAINSDPETVSFSGSIDLGNFELQVDRKTRFIKRILVLNKMEIDFNNLVKI